MLRSIDTCQIKVSADQYHVTIWQAQVRAHVRAHRGLVPGFFKLTVKVLVSDWIAGSCQVNLLHS